MARYTLYELTEKGKQAATRGRQWEDASREERKTLWSSSPDEIHLEAAAFIMQEMSDTEDTRGSIERDFEEYEIDDTNYTFNKMRRLGYLRRVSQKGGK